MITHYNTRRAKAIESKKHDIEAWVSFERKRKEMNSKALREPMKLEWINVKERQPDPTNLVLLTDGKRVYLGYMESFGFIDEDNIPLSSCKITHWLPIPCPPPIFID